MLAGKCCAQIHIFAHHFGNNEKDEVEGTRLQAIRTFIFRFLPSLIPSFLPTNILKFL